VIDTLNLFDAGEQIAKLRLQIAVVESHDGSMGDQNSLEMVVFNYGDPLQFFGNEDEAKDGLENS